MDNYDGNGLPIKRLRRSMSQITQGPVRVEYLYDMDGM